VKVWAVPRETKPDGVPRLEVDRAAGSSASSPNTASEVLVVGRCRPPPSGFDDAQFKLQGADDHAYAPTTSIAAAGDDRQRSRAPDFEVKKARAVQYRVIFYLPRTSRRAPSRADGPAASGSGATCNRYETGRGSRNRAAASCIAPSGCRESPAGTGDTGRSEAYIARCKPARVAAGCAACGGVLRAGPGSERPDHRRRQRPPITRAAVRDRFSGADVLHLRRFARSGLVRELR